MEFIKGADVSSLQAMEDYGAKFYDLNGNEADALAILQGAWRKLYTVTAVSSANTVVRWWRLLRSATYSSYGETDQSARAGLPFGFPLQ